MGKREKRIRERKKLVNGKISDYSMFPADPVCACLMRYHAPSVLLLLINHHTALVVWAVIRSGLSD
jgi:hypothetical protein